jgi:hypothetical protein
MSTQNGNGSSNRRLHLVTETVRAGMEEILDQIEAAEDERIRRQTAARIHRLYRWIAKEEAALSRLQYHQQQLPL